MVDAILLGRQRINRISIYQTLQHKLWSWNCAFFWKLTSFLRTHSTLLSPKRISFWNQIYAFFFPKISTKIWVLLCSWPLMCTNVPLFHPCFILSKTCIFPKISSKFWVLLCSRPLMLQFVWNPNFSKKFQILSFVVQPATHVWEESLSLADLPHFTFQTTTASFLKKLEQSKLFWKFPKGSNISGISYILI